MIAIVDYDAGNINSVEKAVRHLGFECVTTRDKDEIANASSLILPGVGAFGDAMSKLSGYGLDSVIKDYISSGRPFLGICLGLQLLYEESEESPGVRGLGILKGSIKKIPKKDGLKVPNIGWNSLEFPKKGRLFEGLNEGTFVYFVHSYYLDAADKDTVKAAIEYGTRIDASVEKDNVFACQFHPEKSSSEGLKILRNFLEIG
ncbi:MAG: imidazole glycerol phosphate synthase subunit HisH [Lachnospiraceae bacterium]|nr:imidazole glycerol phosphate synthase subunit HisH [Lachnospiraceae bacterium]